MESATGLFRPLESRARLVMISFWCYAAISAVAILALVAALMIGVNLYSDVSVPVEDTPPGMAALLLSGIALILYAIIYVICIVFYLMWLYRARGNLPALGVTDARWSPGWSVAWWFIPIMSLFRPYQVVKETWQASDPASSPGWRRDVPPAIFGWWWALFLVDSIGSNVTERLSTRMGGTPSFDMAVTFTFIDIAVLIVGVGSAPCASCETSPRARRSAIRSEPSERSGGGLPPGYGLAEVTLLPEMLLPETLPEIVPDELALPLVPPVVLLTLTPLAFVFVSIVEIVAEVLTDVEQAPLHDALPLVATVPSATDAVLLA
jgi:heme/copper-type cytochrome/quinol oxidase subunit 2